MSNPMIQLMEALEGARRAKDPGADWLNLITVDAEGFPVARIMTIRGVSEESVVVTVNRDSPKMQQLEDGGRYEAHLFWPNVLGQVRMRGAYRVEDPPELAQGWRARAYGGKIVGPLPGPLQAAEQRRRFSGGAAAGAGGAATAISL